jgi:hypothetical protein
LWQLSCLSDWLGDSYVSIGRSAGLHITPYSEQEFSPLAQEYLLDRGPGLFSFRYRGVTRRDCLVALRKRPLCKGCRRVLPFNMAPVSRCVLAPTDAAQRLHRMGWASRSVSAVSLQMAEGLAAFILYWALSHHVSFHRHSQTAEFGEGSNLGYLGTAPNKQDNVGWVDSISTDPRRGGRTGAA